MNLTLTPEQINFALLVETVRTEAYLLEFIKAHCTHEELDKINSGVAKRIDDILKGVQRGDFKIGEFQLKKV